MYVVCDTEDSDVIRIEDRLVQVPTLETILEDEVRDISVKYHTNTGSID